MMAERRIVRALLLFALVLRGFVAWQAYAHPLVANPLMDAREYHTWAARIASGTITGPGVFYQAPLYPYVLGAVYALTGPHAWVAFALNALLDVAAIAVLYSAARTTVGPTAALLAAAMASVYGVALFNVAQVAKSSLDLLLIATLFLALVNAESAATARGDRRAWFATGIALGLGALNRGNLLLVAPLLLARAASHAGGGRLRASRVALCVAGLLLPILPVTLHNAAVGRDFVLTSAHGGFNFYVGNHERADGTSKRLPFIRENPEFEPSDAQSEASRQAGRTLRQSEVSSWWTRRAFAWLREHPADALVLYARKMRLLVAAYEVPDSVDFRFIRRDVGALGFPWLSYGAVLPLAVAGLVLASRHRRPVGPLAFLLAAVALSLLPFYFFSRYRLPLVPLLLPFAAYALVFLARAARARSRAALIAIPVFAGVALVEIPPGWVDRSFAVSEANLGSLLAEQGRADEAIAAYDRAIAERPGYLNARVARASLYRRAGRVALAEAELRAVVAADANDWYARYDLGRILLERGDTQGAIREFETARALWPFEAATPFALGNALRRSGRAGDAIAALRDAIALDPSHDDARWNLALLLIESGDHAEASLLLEALRQRRPNDARVAEALRVLGR
ncbi:MAG: tetratricopeptide repeat protein [bacterium]